MFFITLEGLDRLGKTTQARLLYGHLRMLGYPCIVMRQPGGVVESDIPGLPRMAGEEIRAILKGAELDASVQFSLSLAGFADAAYHVLRPMQHREIVVISDRWVDSCLAYQLDGDRALIRDRQGALLHATAGIMPHLTLLLDADPLAIASDPLRAPSTLAEEYRAMRYDGNEAAVRVRAAYHRLIQIDPHRWAVIHAHRSIADIEHDIITRVQRALYSAGYRRPGSPASAGGPRSPVL